MATYIKHKRTGKRYLLVQESVFQKTITTWEGDVRVETVLPDIRNGELYFHYYCLNPKTGKPWQSCKHGLAGLFEKEEEVR